MERDLAMLVGLVSVVLGAGLCFAGFKVWRLWLALEGLALGFAAGVFVGMVADVGKEGVFGTGALGALVCAILFAAVVPLGTFLTIVFHAAWIAVAVSAPASTQALQESVIAGAALGAIPALIAAVARRPGVILYSSFAGAQSIASGGLLLLALNGNSLGAMSPDSLTATMLGATLVLGLLGMGIQFSSTVSASTVTVRPPISSAAGTPANSSVAGQAGATPSSASALTSSDRTATGGGESYAALRHEIDALKEQLAGEKQRTQSAAATEQRRLQSEVDALRADRDREAGGKAIGAIISLIAFGVLAYWFFGAGGSGEVGRFLFWSGLFNK